MKYVSANEAKQNLGRILEEVQRGPIMIRRYNRDAALMLSPQQYEAYHRYAVEKFNATADRIGRKAQERGMTEKILKQILADD